MEPIFLYDTTLRDGTQGENVNFTALEKIKIAKSWTISVFIILREGGRVPIQGINNSSNWRNSMNSNMRKSLRSGPPENPISNRKKTTTWRRFWKAIPRPSPFSAKAGAFMY